MQIEHVAIWTHQPETLKTFYETYFEAVAGPQYHNPNKQFTSYFLTFTTGARLELMSLPQLADGRTGPQVGYAHLAFAVGAVEVVDALTSRLQNAGYPLADGPRWTGDGYYESVILDPDGNRVEITI